ncbi:hypothetical protein [Salmonella enterica]|uniref:hypothetical protein n=1 Tax=Salmonella enterica TaxID=28901 RepID=UPI000C21D4AD|nr:hypothetical protein [Salmonella enterica]PJH64102.1 hypothetical protein CVR98_26495 [Salmonella enterica subsp. enterica serovar Enteritidis]
MKPSTKAHMIAEYVSELEQRVEDLEESLAFYGDKDNYNDASLDESPIDSDEGRIARRKLGLE